MVLDSAMGLLCGFGVRNEPACETARLQARDQRMDWRFSTFLLFLFALLIGMPWATSDTGLCSSEYVLGVLRDHTKDGALNCFDFWLNRYQTLIGAVVAVGAAAFAWFGINKQVAVANGQAQIAGRQASIALIEVLNNKAGYAVSLFNSVEAIVQCDTRLREYIRLSEQAFDDMIDASGNPQILKKIYSDSYAGIVRSYPKIIKNMEDAIDKAEPALKNIIISSGSRSQIDEFLEASKNVRYWHSRVSTALAETQVIFDFQIKHRKAGLQEFREAVINAAPNIILQQHRGFMEAARSCVAVGELLDAALEDAGGQYFQDKSLIRIKRL
jgi:hypothetical protein